MSITPETIYWVTRLDAVKDALGASVIVCIFIFVLSLGVSGLAGNDLEDHPVLRTLFAMGIVIGLLGAPVAGIATTFIPTSKEYAAMLVVPRVANNETVQELGSKVVDLAAEWLDALKPAKDAKEGK